MQKNARILVVGAGSAMGFHITRLLRAQGVSVTATYRTPRPGLEEAISATGSAAVRLDLRDPAALAHLLARHEELIFTPILTESVRAARLLRPGQRAVFLSSNNVAIDPEEPLYAALAAAERRVREAVPHAVILRPTMIYGHRADRNLSRLMRAAQRWPVLPRPATPALQQPVHYRDLAHIIAGIVGDPDAAGQTLAIAGPEAVTYHQLFRAVRSALGRRSLIVPVPLSVALAGLAVMRRLGVAAPVKQSQLVRTLQDKRPRGDRVMLGTTSLEDGLRALAEDLAANPAYVAGSSPS